jgi:hypothetical protein
MVRSIGANPEHYPAAAAQAVGNRHYARMENEASALSEEWQFVGIVAEGDPIQVQPGHPWTVTPWTPASGRITVTHPDHANERHTMFTYVLEPGGPLTFAAGEFSPNVWGFYIPA